MEDKLFISMYSYSLVSYTSVQHMWTYKTPKYNCRGETFVKRRQEQNFFNYIANKQLCLLYQTLQLKLTTQKVSYNHSSIKSDQKLPCNLPSIALKSSYNEQ